MTAFKSHFINGQWQSGSGAIFSSYNPATEELIWQGHEATSDDIQNVVAAARSAFSTWSHLDINTRTNHLKSFADTLAKNKDFLAKDISTEMGKPLWEAKTEVAAMINKIPISIEAYRKRCPETTTKQPQGQLTTRHRPHGIMAVLGPFNFPGHLPNGHIVPALLAGNTIIFKPSEQTPLTAQRTVEYWQASGLPNGVLNLIQGAAPTGKLLAQHHGIDGILFTGSWPIGRQLAEQFASTPYKMLALEMGGNNPLIIGNIANIEAAAYLTIQSAFITTGQRCTCARRLIIPQGIKGDNFLAALITMTKSIRIGAFTDTPEPFIGPLVSKVAAENVMKKQAELLTLGARPLLPMEYAVKNTPFLKPGIIDVTPITKLLDQEIFGPLLQVIRVADFTAAINEGNHTKYGLAAGLLSDNMEEFQQFNTHIRAGIVNWNVPLTGASSAAPFGGIGQSGNHRPSALYSADYCAYPVSSLETPILAMPSTITPGISTYSREIS